MTRRKRFAHQFSYLFLLLGAALLLYTALTWTLSMRRPAVIDRSPKSIPLPDLPAGLAPAPRNSAVEEREWEPAPSAVEPLPDAEAVPLLPQSPMIELAAPVPVRDSAPVLLPQTAPGQPQRIVIPALGIDAPVQPVGLHERRSAGRTYTQWSVPDSYAAGWHDSSATLGRPGNIVLNGHNNVHGAIFGALTELAVGEQIVLFGPAQARVYRVAHHELLPEKGLSLRERLRNARWIGPTEDDRLTLVTCWPNATNSHRLVVVAEPLEDAQAK